MPIYPLQKVDVRLQIVDKPDAVRDAFLKEISGRLNRGMKRAIPKIKRDVAGKLARVFYSSNVYTDLLNGPLDAMLGIPSGESLLRTEAIIQTIIHNMEYKYTPVSPAGAGLSGGLEVSLMQADFSDILSLPQSTIVDSKGNVLPWLDWLLLKGDSIIIAGYGVKMGAYGKSRSGHAITVHSSTGWRVPPQYSGLINDNWLTRAVDSGFNYIDSLISLALETHIKDVLS